MNKEFRVRIDIKPINEPNFADIKPSHEEIKLQHRQEELYQKLRENVMIGYHHGVKRLLEEHRDLEVRKIGIELLEYACFNRDRRMIDLLLQYGAIVPKPTTLSSQTSQTTSDEYKLGIQELLVRLYNIYISEDTEIKKTILYLIKNLRITLEDIDCRVDTQTHMTLLHKAIEDENYAFALALLRKGANPFISDKDNQNAVDAAIASLKPFLVRSLIREARRSIDIYDMAAYLFNADNSARSLKQEIYEDPYVSLSEKIRINLIISIIEAERKRIAKIIQKLESNDQQQ
ncbi:MAG: ankyrin repeat domain-containing protein [Candidatus Micrarchaeota archaeon]|nr:ankyrin repeat domain-containing protein [Candidatus Micrarchaeota archaeon]